eukprot:jgi/Orpsp1_1/1174445/evm.model.c7180000050129.1
MYRTPLNTQNQNKEEINSNNQKLFSAILHGNVNSTSIQRMNTRNSFNNNNNNNNNKNNNNNTSYLQGINNNSNTPNNISLGDELPLLELGDLSLVEPSTSQNFRVRSLLNPRSHIQSQHRFHKKLIRPKLLQQRNAREKKFPYTTIKKTNGIRKNQSILKYSKLIDYGLAEQLESININKEAKSSLFYPNSNGKKILNIESLFPNKYIELKQNTDNYTNRNLLSIPSIPKEFNLNDLENSMISQREFKYDNIINDWKFIINSLGLSGDMNMLKIFTLGTRFSDLVHKIQQEDTLKKLYISSSERENVSLNFNALETLTNQSVVNNLNSQIDAVLLSVIDNDKNGLSTSQRLSAQNLLLKKSTAPLVRSIFISEYLSGRNLFSPNNEFQRRLCILLEDSELIRFISSLVDAEKLTKNDQDILNRILVESSLSSIICEDDNIDMINDEENSKIKSSSNKEEDDNDNSAKQYGQILRTIYAASKKASSQEKMIENFQQLQQHQPLPHQQIHTSVPGAFSLESRNYDKSSHKTSQNYSNYTENHTDINLNSSEPVNPSNSNHIQPPNLQPSQPSLHPGFPETPTTPTPHTPAPLTPILQFQRQQQQQESQSENPSSLNFSSLNL